MATSKIKEIVYPRNGHKTLYGIVCKKYYGQYQLIVDIPNTANRNITITSIYVGKENSDLDISAYSVEKYKSQLRIGISSDEDLSGYMGYVSFTIS
jgi:hypothetical protein